MKAEDRSKLQSLVGEIEGLKSRQPEESKFKDWKEKVEKKLEEAFGKGSEQLARFRRTRFFDFGRSGKPKDTPLSELERRQFLQALDEAKRTLQRYL
jgi:hypothetical protein